MQKPKKQSKLSKQCSLLPKKEKKEKKLQKSFYKFRHEDYNIDTIISNKIHTYIITEL